MNRSVLAHRIARASRLSGQFRLRSGKTSNVYWDKYRFESDPVLLAAITDQLLQLAAHCTFDRYAGLELGGVPLATALSLRSGVPCAFVRKKPKEYGTCNLVEGGAQPGERLLVVEDVITTAGQVVASVRALRELGFEITDVLCVIDREAGGREKLAEIGCKLHPLFTMRELEAAWNQTT